MNSKTLTTQANCSLLKDTRQMFSNPKIPSSPALASEIDSFETEDSPFIEKDNLKIIKKIGDSRFPLFLVWSNYHQQQLIMKVFISTKSQSNEYYLNESRFCKLHHPNIVSIVSTVGISEINNDKGKFWMSYILMKVARCSFDKVIHCPAFIKDEKFARTYFHQLVNGIEYLHSQGIAHLDLKPANLLLAEGYSLKITDFDLSNHKEDILTIGMGSFQFRAPEIKNKNCKKPMLADIYSLGITLFALKTGIYPYLEDKEISGYKLDMLLFNDPEKYWEGFEKITKKTIPLDLDFKKLFVSMTKFDPKQRATLSEIKQSNWYNKSIYSKQELEIHMKRVISEIETLL